MLKFTLPLFDYEDDRLPMCFLVICIFSNESVQTHFLHFWCLLYHIFTLI